MQQKAAVDRLIDMCERNAEQISELWYKAVSTSTRTASVKSMPKEGLIRHAVNFYKNLGKMYFADNCYQAVEHVLDVGGFIEDFYARGIPIEEVIYTMILMRRHIWLYADQQALYSPVIYDMYDAINSTNRVLLVFDYATYIVARKYREFSERKK